MLDLSLIFKTYSKNTNFDMKMNIMWNSNSNSKPFPAFS